VPKLTKSVIDRIPLPERKPDGKPSQAIHRDEALKGFGLLVGSGGTKTFFIERRVSGKVKRITIGRYGLLTPSEARSKAQELLGEIAKGNDPLQDRRDHNAQTITLSEAFEDYLATRKNLKQGTIKNYRKCVDGCLGDWLNKRLIDISKDMIQKRHSDIGSRAPARANNTMRVLRAIFNHSLTNYENSKGLPLLPFNPVDRIKDSRAWYRVDRRRTLLRPHELKPWYEATAQLPHDVTRDYFRFLLFTGFRKMEAASLKWSDISFEDKMVTIQDTKNREPHSLPLSNYLFEMLSERRASSQSEWVFQSPVTESHIREPRGALSCIAEKMGRNVGMHDLRRTFITIAESLDIPAYALKRLINHRDASDVTAGYIVSNVDRLREPMEKISKFISFNVKEGVS
jgi:integrase